MTWWTPQLHSIVGGLVAAVGAFVMWERLPPMWAIVFAASAIVFLWWQAPSIGAVWAWATLMLGIESMVWPIATMIQIRQGANQPTEEQMGTILNAVFFGLFSSVFWVTFSFGLFKRAREQNTPPASPLTKEPILTRGKKKRTGR